MLAGPHLLLRFMRIDCLYVENDVTWHELVWPYVQCAMCIMTDQHIWSEMRQSIVIRWTSTNWFIKISLSLSLALSLFGIALLFSVSHFELLIDQQSSHIWLNHDDGTFFEWKITEIGIERKAQALCYIKCDKYSLRLCIQPTNTHCNWECLRSSVFID